MTIWKFPIAVSDRVVVLMPRGAKVLHVAVQDKVPCLWAQVDPAERPEARVFRIYGTGHTFYFDKLNYVGTFQMPPYVWHLFEEVE